MFEIVEMYIFQFYLHYFYNMLYIKVKPWFNLVIRDFVPEIHFFEKIFPVFIDW